MTWCSNMCNESTKGPTDFEMSVVTTNEMICGHAEMLKGRRLRMNALNSEHYMTCKHMR
jgi:hypothetical protein